VRDTGAGIAPELLGKVFDPFFTTKPVGEGTGLGLTISHRIVEEHGGAIDVESAPGAGTAFTITLPAASP
jgi:signal transduction histidine kinase